MNAETPLPLPSPRGRCQGMWHILQFNWPFYVAGTIVCLAGMAMLQFLPFPLWLQTIGGLGIGVALFWVFASLLVSFYVYDLSPLYRWEWLPSLFAQMPRSWTNIHAGLDETSLSLRALFPTEQWQVLDLYNPDEITEPSLRRARALTLAPASALAANPAALPVEDEATDAVFLLFAAHEIRDAQKRLKFFQELQRITKPQGKVILVEHLRDTANFIAFGPGFWHFLPECEWRRLAQESGFALQTFRMTPFVRVLVLEKHSAQALPEIAEFERLC